MDKYVTFLRARLDAQEEFALDDLELPTDNGIKRYARMTLAEIAAKRKILDDYEVSGFDPAFYDSHDAASGHGDAYETVIKTLCEPHRQHPEYPGERA